MSDKTPYQSDDYARVIADLVADMPVERAAQVYDFARFIKSQTTPSPLMDEDWLDDSEEQMRLEDAEWNEATATHRKELDTLLDKARKEIAADATKPMFDEHGDLTVE